MTRAYRFLLVAIVGEICGTIALKYSDGMRLVVPGALAFVGFGIGIWALAQAVRTLPIGFANAVWAGSAIAATSVIGLAAFGEPANVLTILGTLLIIAGVVLSHLASARRS